MLTLKQITVTVNVKPKPEEKQTLNSEGQPVVHLTGTHKVWAITRKTKKGNLYHITSFIRKERAEWFLKAIEDAGTTSIEVNCSYPETGIIYIRAD